MKTFLSRTRTSIFIVVDQLGCRPSWWWMVQGLDQDLGQDLVVDLGQVLVPALTYLKLVSTGAVDLESALLFELILEWFFCLS